MTFDLKGSAINRAVKLSDKSVVDVMTKKYNLKDMNFLQVNRIFGKTLINLKDEVALRYREVLERDSFFLCSQGLMDYSLLIGIE